MDNLTTGAINFNSATPVLMSCSLKKVVHPTDYVCRDDNGDYWRVTSFQEHYELIQITAKIFNSSPITVGGAQVSPDVTAQNMIAIDRPSDIALDECVNSNEHDGWELGGWDLDDLTEDHTGQVIINGQVLAAPIEGNEIYVVTATLRIVTEMKVDRNGYRAEKLDDPSTLSDAPDA